MTRWGLALAVVCVLGTVARADDTRESAKTLFDSGRKAVEQNNYTVACALFEKSYQLDPAAGTRLNLAECRQRDKKWREAWLLWISSAEDFEKIDDTTNRARAKFARDQADKLSDKLAKVVVHVARPETPGIVLTINDRKIDPATTVIELVEAGSATVRVEAPGRQSFETTVEAEVGKRVVVEVPKLRRSQQGAVDDGEPRTSRTSLWTGIAIAGGVTTIGAFAYYVHLINRKDALERCTVPQLCGYASAQERDDDGRHTATLANVAMWTTAAAAVVTTVFVVKAVRSRKSSKATAISSWSTMVVPVVSPTGATASLRLSF